MKNTKIISERSIRELKRLSEALKPKEGEVCVYCGMLATDKEHVIPISWIKEMEEMRALGFNVKIPEEVIVPSCRECNSIAGATIFNSFNEKKNFIRNRLIQKYKKFIYYKPWTDKEIDELGGRLREQVFMFNELAVAIRKRLRKIINNKK